MDIKFDSNDIKWFKGYKNLPQAYLKIKTPSVTGIINDMVPDPGLEEWIKEVGKEKAEKIMKAAGHRGTAMHVFIEEFLKVYKISRDPSKALKHTQKNAVLLLEEQKIPKDKIDIGRDLFYNFYSSEHIDAFLNLLGIELPVYSPFLYFRGLADIVYKRKGYGLASSDFKTSSTFIERGSIKEKKYKLQLGAYGLALDHMFKDKGIKTNYSSIISMHTKSSMIQLIECEGQDLEENKKEFKTLVKEWHKNNNQEFLFN